MPSTAPPGQEIPHDDVSPNDIKPIYSLNRLLNPSAEAGTLEHWETTGVTVLAGGPEGSANTFKLQPMTGYLKQVLSAEGTQPSDYRVGGYFLPDKASKAEDVKVSAYVKVTYTYADGSEDIALVPVKGAVSNGS